MPRLTATVGNDRYRLRKYSDDGYDIQQRINGMWNTVDTFGKVYYGTPRPWAYMGYSFATPGLAFEHFRKIKRKQE